MKEDSPMLTPVDVALRVTEKATKRQSEATGIIARHLHDGLMNEVFTLYVLVEGLLDFQLASGTLNDYQKRRCYRLMKRIKAHRRDLNEQVRSGKRSALEAALKEWDEARSDSTPSEPAEAD